jgi:hypothetical protein
LRFGLLSHYHHSADAPWNAAAGISPGAHFSFRRWATTI